MMVLVLMEKILLIKMPDADFKFYIAANLKTRAKRRYDELEKLNPVKYKDVLKALKT